MRARFVFEVSLRQLWNNFKSTLVVILSLTVCVTSVFLMAEALLYSNSFLENMDVNRRTYTIDGRSVIEDYAATYGLYDEIMYNDRLPEISQFTGIYANPIVQWNVEEYIAAEIYIEDDKRYPVEVDLIEGRSFSEQEILEGTNVVIISNEVNYWREGNELRVGDEVLINDIPYEIIGIARDKSYITEENIRKNQNFSINFIGIVFTERLSGEEEQTLKELFAMVNATMTSRYSQIFAEFVMHVFTYIILIGLVLYCAFSIIAQLFNYMVKSREYEYRIYKVLGIRAPLLFALYFTPILMVSVLSGCLGMWIYRYSEHMQRYIEMDDKLPFNACMGFYLLIGGVLLLATLPNYVKLKRQSAVETR